MRPYKHLSLDERRKVEEWRGAIIRVDVSAERLGRNRSTLFRELRRNQYQDAELPKVVGYWGVVALMKALSRRHKDRKLMRRSELRDVIVDRIKTASSRQPAAQAPAGQWAARVNRRASWL